MIEILLWIIVDIVVALIGAFFMLFLERKGIIDKLTRKFVWPPYYYDHQALEEAVKDAEDKFYLITGDGSFLFENWASDILDEIIERSKSKAVYILFTGDVNLPEIRKRIYELYNRSKSLHIHILANVSLSQSLRATFSVNIKQYCCLRVGLDEKTGQYIVKRYSEPDLIKLIVGYFDLTPSVVNVEKKDEQIKIIYEER